MAYNLRTGLIGSGDIDINVSLNNLDAANITSGIFNSARIPDLSANKITSDTLGLDRIPNLDSSKIPNLSANKITSDILGIDRIPGLNADKITTGVLDNNRIPVINTADKIPDLQNLNGVLPASKVPNLQDMNGTLNTSQLSDITAQDNINIHGSVIDDGTITGDELNTDAVSTIKIMNGAVTANKIANGAIESQHLNNEIISTSRIVQGAVDSTRLAVNAVTTTKILDGAVTTNKIVNGAVTTAKLASGVLPEPGYHVSPGTYRKIQILPSDFMRGGASSINLTSAEYPIDSKLKGIVYSTNGVGIIYAHVSIPAGYKAISLKIFALNMIGAQTVGTARNLQVEAYKVNMSYTSKQNLYYSSQYCNTENTFSSMDENMMPVNLTPTFDEESFLLIGVTIVSANPQPQGVYGGWVKIKEE